jgi:hypothetical protein
MTQTHVSFAIPTTNTDGSAITLALTYAVLIDTVNPPVKSYPVPAAVVAANGILAVTFAQLGFAPLAGASYFAGATATDSSGTSALSAVAAFKYDVAPNAPTSFTVA